ncbi:hypothetical protein EDD85DRAFT_793788 [Armillaria nabsnona]|nr:hypothetical protein EDD85DRAFT_793788 [Armillaria nabsnona]
MSRRVDEDIAVHSSKSYNIKVIYLSYLDDAVEAQRVKVPNSTIHRATACLTAASVNVPTFPSARQYDWSPEDERKFINYLAGAAILSFLQILCVNGDEDWSKSHPHLTMPVLPLGESSTVTARGHIMTITSRYQTMDAGSVPSSDPTESEYEYQMSEEPQSDPMEVDDSDSEEELETV